MKTKRQNYKRQLREALKLLATIQPIDSKQSMQSAVLFAKVGDMRNATRFMELAQRQLFKKIEQEQFSVRLSKREKI